MPIIKVNDVSQGVNLDLSPEELQAGWWSNAANMRFVNGYATRFKGMAQTFGTPSITPYWIAPYQTPTSRFWIHAGAGQVFADDGTTRTEITRLAALQVSSITFATTTATLTTTSAHGLTTGNTVTIYGAVPAIYNSTYTVTVTSTTAFTYTVASTPSGNATVPGWVIKPGAAVSNFTGTQDDRWTGGAFSGNLVLNNGVDLPQYWDGTAAKLRNLTGWNPAWKCDVMVPFKQYLVSLGITKSGAKYPHMVKWSAAALPGAIPTSWDETDVTRDAGELDLAETPDLLVDALPLGDMLIVYKERSMYALRFIGQPFIFQVQRLPGDVGMMARGCGANTPLGHVVLTSGDVVLVTPQGPQSIADGKVRRFIFNNIDANNFRRAFVCTNPQKFEVLVCFPVNGSAYCNMAAVWNWATQTWGLRDLPNATYGASGQISNSVSTTWATDTETWALDATTWNENEYAPGEARLMFSTPTAIRAFDVGTSDDGSTQITGSLERVGMYFDDASTVKLLRGIRPRIDAPNGAQVTVQAGAAMTPDSAPIWSDPVTFTAGSDFKADTFSQGRYLAIRLSCNRPWRIRSLDLDIVPTGSY